METYLVNYRGYIGVFLLTLIIAEMIWSWRNNRQVYELKETVANFTILIGFQLSKLLFVSYQLFILGWAGTHKILEFGRSIGVFFLTFLLADFIYYWFHRVSHDWKPLWALHLIHHSSLLMNLTTAYRLNWLSAIVSPILFMPLAVLGFPTDFIVLSYAINLLYQFFLHTEVVGKLGWLEGLINTPSAHRVHHGSNPLYIDKNFGGFLIIWDRLFGTYQEELEKPMYGTTVGFISYNPIVLVFKGLIDWARGTMKYKG